MKQLRNQSVSQSVSQSIGSHFSQVMKVYSSAPGSPQPSGYPLQPRHSTSANSLSNSSSSILYYSPHLPSFSPPTTLLHSIQMRRPGPPPAHSCHFQLPLVLQYLSPLGQKVGWLAKIRLASQRRQDVSDVVFGPDTGL